MQGSDTPSSMLESLIHAPEPGPVTPNQSELGPSDLTSTTTSLPPPPSSLTLHAIRTF